MGTLTFLGQVTLGVYLPLLLALSLQVNASLAALVPQLSARLAGYLALSAKIAIKPPSLLASIDLAGKIVASLNAALSTGFVPPSVDFTGSLLVGLIAQLQAQLTGLQALLSLALQVKGLTAAGGFSSFLYQGPLSDLGARITAQAPAQASLDPSTPVVATLLLVEASNTSSVAAMNTLFKTS